MDRLLYYRCMVAVCVFTALINETGKVDFPSCTPDDTLLRRDYLLSCGMVCIYAPWSWPLISPSSAWCICTAVRCGQLSGPSGPSHRPNRLGTLGKPEPGMGTTKCLRVGGAGLDSSPCERPRQTSQSVRERDG